MNEKDSPIRYYGDKVLRHTIADVKFPEEGLETLANSMFLIMYKEGGVGLAANQVGIDVRMAVIDVKQDDPNEEKIVLINPTIIKTEGEERITEGCLSLPGIKNLSNRFASVEVENHTYTGEKEIIKADGLLAIALQHEIDHLNGKLFTDRLSDLEKNMLSNKLKRLARESKKHRKEQKNR